jgi:hypothetical protein
MKLQDRVGEKVSLRRSDMFIEPASVSNVAPLGAAYISPLKELDSVWVAELYKYFAPTGRESFALLEARKGEDVRNLMTVNDWIDGLV